MRGNWRRLGRLVVYGPLGVLALALARGPAEAAQMLCVAPGGAGGCFATIQAAVNAAANGAVIDVAAGTYFENVVISAPSVLTIAGAGAGATVIDGGGAGSVISVQNRRLTLSGVTVQNGSAALGGGLFVESLVRLSVADAEIVDNTSTEGGGIFAAVRSNLNLSNVLLERNVGGAIGIDSDPDGVDGVKGDGARLTMTGGALRDNSDGRYPAIDGQGLRNDVRLIGVTVEQNVATFEDVGVIRVFGKLRVESSVIADNPPGGILAVGSLRVVDSTIRGNGSGNGIGGIAMGTLSSKFRNVLKIERSTISGNVGKGGISGLLKYGGGLDLQNVTATIIASTISGNSADDGAGIRRLGRDRLILSNSTVAGNTASGAGGGIFVSTLVDSTPVILRATIVADNQAGSAGPDCSATLHSEHANLVEDTTACTIEPQGTGLQTGVDPMLGPLQDNGGPTETHALLAGSPAIDAVTRGVQCRLPDQRGTARVVPCDIGAYEVP